MVLAPTPQVGTTGLTGASWLPSLGWTPVQPNAPMPPASVYPKTSGWTGAWSSVKPVLLIFARLVQIVAAVIWTLQIYFISAFSLWFECLNGGLDTSLR